MLTRRVKSTVDGIKRTSLFCLLMMVSAVLSHSRIHAEEYHPTPALGAGILLIARPGLPDPNFAETVILLIDYSADGALGLIINRPSRHRLAQALPNIEALTDRTDRIYLGGPVATQNMALLLRSSQPPESALHVIDDIYFSLSPSVFETVLEDEANVFHAYAGYAGWSPGQLDREMARGDWRVAGADAEIVFERPPQVVWPELIRLTEGIWVELVSHREEASG